MRIVSGSLKGRVLQLPESERLRPTSERVREAIFSVIFSLRDLDGCAVLDLFAGSGALGIEALSRGASSAMFVERETLHVAALRETIERFGITEQCQVMKGSVERWLASADTGQAFDFVFVDPPYEAHPGVQLLELLLVHKLLTKDALVVVESDRSLKLPEGIDSESSFLRLVKKKEYGTTQVHFFRFETVEPGTEEKKT